jgi:hypothetical protein
MGGVGGGHLCHLHVAFSGSNEEAGVPFKVGGEEELAPAGLDQHLPSAAPHQHHPRHPQHLSVTRMHTTKAHDNHISVVICRAVNPLVWSVTCYVSCI